MPTEHIEAPREVPDRQQPGRRLCAILLNPALRSMATTITYRNVEAALQLVSCTELALTNLLDLATKDAPELNRSTISNQGIEAARDQISQALLGADEVLLAWGTGGMTGPVRTVLRAQTEWLFDALKERRIGHVWTITDKPRHPSRWRQYVGPEKQRVTGDTFEERLSKVLIKTSLSSAAGRVIFDRAF
ncbi:DUF1643 domain-containing protein [Rhizohabitans arisaemae]|uniref:DUF1643 domain-containing protein n=1 Tax=Rhizohabitans arisaemae TaxID=2720610 RepID=UPI0024B1B648|nr:DUF1643 domain-containing protein [Rhizohabitans arisaemae]